MKETYTGIQYTLYTMYSIIVMRGVSGVKIQMQL